MLPEGWTDSSYRLRVGVCPGIGMEGWLRWFVHPYVVLESLDFKEIQPVHSKRGQSWVFFGRTDAKAETPILWSPHVKSWLIGNTLMPEGIGGRRRGDDRGWDGWMASGTRWKWVWVNSGSWWWTGRPGVLRFMGSQKAGHDWVTELNWCGVKCRGTCVVPCFCSWHTIFCFQLFRNGSWSFFSHCVFWFSICPNCTCTQLSLLLYSFFLFCCLSWGVSKCKLCSSAVKGSRYQPVSPPQGSMPWGQRLPAGCK